MVNHKTTSTLKETSAKHLKRRSVSAVGCPFSIKHGGHRPPLQIKTCFAEVSEGVESLRAKRRCNRVGISRSRAVAAPGESEGEAHELGVRHHAVTESFPIPPSVQLFQSGVFVDEPNYLSSRLSHNAHCPYNRASGFEIRLNAIRTQYIAFATSPLFFAQQLHLENGRQTG